MKRVWILIFLCAACTAPVRRADGGSAQPTSLSSSSGFQPASAPRFDADLRPQKEQDLETIGRSH